MDDPIRARLDEFEDTILELLGISIVWTEGLERLVADPGAFDSSTTLSQAAKDRLTEIATAELHANSPKVNGQLALGLWSALEALVEDVFIMRIDARPEWLHGAELEKVRVPLAQFLRLDRDEAVRLLVSRIEGGSAPERFEHVLGLVGLSGSLDGSVYQSIRELEGVRNVLMHRGGLADARAVAVAYQLEMTEGERIKVDDEHFSRYELAVEAYGKTLVARLDAEQAGLASSAALPVSPREIDVEAAVESLSTELE